MMTLREMRDDPNLKYDEERSAEICAQILFAVFQSEVVPMSPDDVIADPEEDVFEVRRSDSGDFSFAPPEVLMTGRDPDDGDRRYVIGMIIHYLWSNVHEDLATAARMPLVRLYALRDEQKSPLLYDAGIRRKLGDSGENDLLKHAIALTGSDADKRTEAEAQIRKWILGIESQAVFVLMENGVNVGQYVHTFQKGNPRNVKLSAGKGLTCNGVQYRFTEDRLIEFRPGRHAFEIAVKRVR